ncbi:nickel/cobalt efflux transporter [Phenylobacterium montanum]|uniref:Nickel/cobalt efflux system n=1 Tax=Phenylobacterium montanum TaxID=2823693 RepID=A0A975IWD7_9CAUL|nr:nickel/cobalt efflux transporter [Caulobacter sp. S6]QUD89730.1 nickel/cobalt efflux transporter RcnA [Caulobacter sp. S6]
MPDLAHLIAAGSANLWLFIPTAVLLGALHGLEPGHSKTMMAAFIIAVRGTVGQAVMLGLSATASHTLVVWLVALGGLWFGRNLNVETSEPWFQLASAIAIVSIAAWMIWRTAREARAAAHAHDHGHSHDHGHHDHDQCDHDHHHDHGFDPHALLEAAGEAQDAHEREHAAEIMSRFAGKPVTNGQIILFGLTGGLIPCPAAITVLLLCLQVKKIALGAVLVAGFSVGLALTMVTFGVVAAVGLRKATQRWQGLDGWMRRAPYLSGGLVMSLGLILGVRAAMALAG